MAYKCDPKMGTRQSNLQGRISHGKSMNSLELSQQLMNWLSLVGGPGWKGEEARDLAVLEMRKIGADKLFPLLIPFLNSSSSDINIRCKASRAVLGIDQRKGIELLLPLFNDSDTVFRWDICGLMHEFGDERVLDSLIERMKDDADPQVRGTAAYALGGIGNPKALPSLLITLENDHEFDELGYSPSFSAKTAIDEIRRKNQQT